METAPPPPPRSAKADLVFEMKALEKAFKSGKPYGRMKKHELELRLNILKKAMGITSAILPAADEVIKPAESAPLGMRQIPVRDVLDGTASIKVPTAPVPRTNTATKGPQRQINRVAAYTKIAKEIGESPVSTLFKTREAPKQPVPPGTAAPYEKKLPKDGEPLTFGQKMAIARAAKKAAREAALDEAPAPVPKQIAKPEVPKATKPAKEIAPSPAPRKLSMKAKIAAAEPLALVIGEEGEDDDPISLICRKL